ncbi:hypothetical protein CDEST_13611 [Colletotrichum destructivum]|uniref:Extracellular membrane protein CFEM domain-containing protein n=1 Tax=Colletotrichum destructivum TaxID=34406 RepID=A0AAX4IZA8_9PEZI|nr:hypothetical protein CDEST_13611 [Colletotrichum destructivum]
MKDGTFDQMSTHTMALKPLLRILSLILSASLTTATSFNLSSEITRLVPLCARECFHSHLSANYALATCGSAPSLQCLCANVGLSDLTIGEGAVQCIVAEKSIGFCRESDAPQTVIDAAHQMCANQPGAIRPTHTAIIATLILPTSGGIIVVPPRTATPLIPPTSTVHLTTSIPTTLISATGTPSLPKTPTTLTGSNTSRISATSSTNILPSLPPSSTTTNPSATALPGPGAEEANSGSSERLGTGQIAGLAVGLAAALGLAVLAICLARRRRRRNYPDVKTGFLPVREKDSWGHHPREGPVNIFHISPPVHHAQSPSPPPRPPPAAQVRASGRTSWWPGAIGMAVSRSDSPSTALRSPPPQQNRPTSRLLPAKPSLLSPKPVLSLKIPQNGLSASTPSQPQEQIESQPTNSQIFKTAKLTAPPKRHYDARESTMTEFEEDSAITSARSARSNNIWRPPSAIAGSNPKSATYYVADKNGNWVLGDPKSAVHMAQIAELDASGASEGGGARAKPSYAESAMLAVTATTAGIGHGAGSPVAPSAARMPPPPVLLPAAEIVRSGTLAAPPAAYQSRSSSVYSQGTTRPNTSVRSAGAPQIGGASHPAPSMSFSHPEPPRRRSNSLGRRSSSKSKAVNTGAVPVTAVATAANTVNAPKRSDSHDSQASVTTIASSFASSVPEPVIEQNSLSPVVESPVSNASPNGRSPVSYPAIPGRTTSKARNDNPHLLAPPTRTYGGFPPGQPSPTLGMTQQQRPPRKGPYMASYDVPRKPIARPRPAAAAAAATADPSKVATGSPSLRIVTPSPPSGTEALQQEPHWKPAQTQRPPQMKPLYPPPLQPQRPRIERSDFHPQPQTAQVQHTPRYQEPQSATVHKALWGDPPLRATQQQQQQPPQQQPQQWSSYAALPSQQHRQLQQLHPQTSQQSFSQRQRRRSQQQQRQSFQPAALPEQSPPPNQRLPERPLSASPSPHHVATQALRPTPNLTSTPESVSSSSSTIQPTAPPPRPPSPLATSPSVATPSTTSSLLSKRLGSERAAALALPTAGIRHSPNWRPYRPGGAVDTLLSPDNFFPAAPGFPSRSFAAARSGDLPSTPTWQPTLTPTRRGDDLFLNVQ